MASNLYSTTEHQCEIVCGEAHGANSNYTNCKTNPGHKNFLTVAEFGMEHLPPTCRTEKCVKYIQSVIDLTVKITVSSTSEDRPDTFPGCQKPYPFIEHRGSNSVSRCGTGFIGEKSLKIGPCPCPECKRSKHPKMKYWEFIVETATHVVFDSIEAESVVVDLFYDTEDKHGVKHLYGLRVNDTYCERYQTDKCDVVCVTHDAGLLDRIDHALGRYTYLWRVFLQKKIIMIVSHPHGASKKISIGKRLRAVQISPLKLKKGTRVFIPSNFDSNHDQQEHTKHCDRECVSDNPPSNDAPTHTLITPTSHTTGEKNPEMSNVVKPKGNVTTKSECHFYDLLNPIGESNMFELKADVDALSLYNDFDHPQCSHFHDWHLYTVPSVVYDGRVIDVPKGTKFDMTRYIMHDDNVNNYLTYDAPTCPGSSGAAIIGNLYNPLVTWRHFGSCGSGTENRSGVSYI